MEKYLPVVNDLAQNLFKFTLTRVPHGENNTADTLTSLASTSNPDLG